MEAENALTKQYSRLFEMEGVKLRFTDDALMAVARKRTVASPAPAACARSWKK